MGAAMKTTLAISAGKLTSSLISWLRLGAGTSLPGKVARRIDPDVLRQLGRQVACETVAVTGTNGKTTTCGLLAEFIRADKRRVVHNQLGANMLPGITAALVNQSSLDGRLQADYAVLEVDEASLKGVTAEIDVRRVAVTNLFRDQLDRYGELDTTARLIETGLRQSGGRAVLNADDPLVAALGLPLDNPLYYGINAVDYEHAGLPDCPVAFPREVTQCPRCGGALEYHRVLYGHLGHYACRGCGYARPEPAVCAEHILIRAEASDIRLRYGAAVLTLTLPLPGLFNVYNFLAAAAMACELGLPQQVLETGLGNYHSVFGRAERKRVDGKPVMVMLIKNPVGASEVLKLVGRDPDGRLMIALNDNYADGRDVSWIWDAAFEAVSPEKTIVVSGVRAEDMALRLKYAGVPEERILLEPDLKTAVSKALADVKDGEKLYILPTYTALLSLRNLL